MDLIDYDFIEIGTGDFDTMIQNSNNEFGLSIEPIKYYLDRLPNRPNVKKINCAVSFDDIEKNGKIYYITDEDIKKHNLPDWMRGCNKLNDFHYQHKLNKIEHLVKIENIVEKPISNILIENKVKKIKHLKIDTEGGDCFILGNLKKYIQNKDKTYWPQKIVFETNELSSNELQQKTINDYTKLGYKFRYNDGFNTKLVL